MELIPEWAQAVPATPLVHPTQDNGFTRPFSQQQLLQMGADLLEQMLRRVVLAITHAFLPGIPAFEQLQQWADSIGDLLWFLEGDMLIELVSEHIGELLDINWLSPTGIWEAITSSWDFWKGVANWAMTVLKNITGIDLTEQSEFLKDLAALFALDELQDVWVTFFNGWNAINWSNPLAVLHSAWMLLVDLFWGVIGWFQTVLTNLTGIDLPGFLAFDDLKAAWAAFNTAWNAINWSNPLTGIHSAWMAVVDLGWDVTDWAGTVFQNLTGIDLPAFFDLDGLRAAWNTFNTDWAAANGLWGALAAVGNWIRGIAHWMFGVFQNLTGIDLENLADSFNITGLANILTTWGDALSGINWGAGGALMTAIGAFISLFQGAGNWILGVIESWLGWDTDAVGNMFSGVGPFVENIIQFFFGTDGLAGWVRTLEMVAGEVGASITDALHNAYLVVEPIFAALSNIFDGSAFTSFVVGIFEWFAGLARDIQSFTLDDILRQIPILSGLIPMVTGDDPGGAPGLGVLGEWARGIEKMAQEAKEALDDLGEKLLGGLFPASQIGDSEPNLLAQGDFKVAQTVTEADGWAWDGTLTASGTGGSVKHVSTGSASTLYAKQNIKVVAGNPLTLSAQVRTADYSSGSMSLILIPWAGTSRYSSDSYVVTVATRSSAAADWTTISGNWTVPATVTSVTVGLVSNINSGATARFDDIYLRKTGGVKQNFVDSLLTTWEGFWEAIFGGSGAGKIWSDAVSAIEELFGLADDAFDDAAAAAGQGLGIIDSIGKAVFGEATYQTLPGQVKTTLQHFINRLFGINTVGTELTGDVLPPLDASTMTLGTLPIGVVPTTAIGATINPSAGSGALLIRSASEPVAPRTQNSRNFAPDGFFTNLQVSSTDISCLKTDGTAGTGVRADYAGAFKVANAGWYMVELSVRINVGFGSGAFSCAPVLYKGSTLAGSTAYKIGSDCHNIWIGSQVQHRFVQNSWIVYLAANEIVRAGFDTAYAGAASSGLGGESGTGTSGVETYFSISLLNKSFA